MQNFNFWIILLYNLAGEINIFFITLVLLLLGIQDLQWVKNRLRGISMRLTENYKFGKTHFSLESVPRFWLAKSTRIIHHNQLLMTKFERILCLTRNWRQKCSVFAGWSTVKRKDLATRLSCFGCETKNGGHFTRFKCKN